MCCGAAALGLSPSGQPPQKWQIGQHELRVPGIWSSLYADMRIDIQMIPNADICY